MFGLFADLLSSIISVLFPIFASYKALRTSDPAQLAPWLMYWVVYSSVLLAESWTVFIIGWMPFYSTIRLFLLAYLVLPQTQGAKIIYYNHIEPFLEDHEREIEAFIGDAHERLKALGLQYLTQLIDYVRVNVLGMAAREPEQTPTPVGAAGYAQSLLARFSLPNARFGGAAGGSGGIGTTGTDAFSLLSSAFAAAGILSGNTSSPANTSANTTSSTTTRTLQADQLSASGTLFPKTMDSASSAEKLTFLTSQRERLAVLMTALDKEQAQLSGLAYGHDYSRELRSDPSTLESDIERRMHEIDATSGGLGSLRSTSSSSNPPSSFLGNVTRTVSSNFPILSSPGGGETTPTLSNLKRDRSENSFEEIAHEDVRSAESSGYQKGSGSAGPEIRGRAKRTSSGGWGAGWFAAGSPGEN